MFHDNSEIISHNDLVLPIFVREGKNKVESIKSMPGVKRYSIDKLSTILKEVEKFKIPMVAIFPYTPKNKKTIMVQKHLIQII